MASLDMDTAPLEVIEFAPPLENDKNLLVTYIPTDFEDEASVQEVLWEVFNKYGLLYEVQVKTNIDETKSCQGQFYAFVKFYSARAAAKAHKDLAGRFYLKGRHVRVRYAIRKKKVSNYLYSVKCYELANYYLGFNGWATQIVSMTLDKGAVDPGMVRYFCALKLTLPAHGVTTEGVGVGEKTYNPEDMSTKSTAMCVASKRAHQHAVEAAFSRLILVVLQDGRVYADVNFTIEDSLEQQNLLTTEGVVKVNELDEEPQEEGDDQLPDERNQDELNQQILAELDDD